MFRNYFKIAVRNLMRQRLYSIINLSGLSIGMACFLLISLWVFDELSFDQFHVNKDRIYRVNTETSSGRMIVTSSWRLGPALNEVYPEIENFTRLWPWNRSLVKYGDKSFDETRFWLADSGFFNIFSFRFIHGTAESSLKDKYAIVLTSETAERYFGDEMPLGKSIFVQQYDHHFIVSGVIAAPPLNSTIQFDLIARVDLMSKQRMESWELTGFTCVLLTQNSEEALVNQKMNHFYQDYANLDWEAHPVLQPLTEMHLYQDGKPGLVKLVRYFSVVALFILLIACINFMNLSTAKSARRSIEVGIRKVVGAQRKQIIYQFFGESILMTVISLLIALLILELLLPGFNQLTGKQISLFSRGIIPTLSFLLFVTIGTGLLSGVYPAFYLSSFQPAKILKRGLPSTDSGKIFRNTLTTFQFAISIGLIICVIITREQLHYIMEKDIGIKRDFVINMPHNPQLLSQYDSYRNELLKQSAVESVTSAASTPFNVGNYIGVNWEGHFDQDGVEMPYNVVEYDFFKTFDMKFMSGRPFSREIRSDETEACVINQSAARLMNFDSPIGKEVYFNHPAFEESLKKVRIIGVVNDFHTGSLHREITPSIFRIYRPYQSYIFIKIRPDNIPLTLDYIKNTTRTFAPDYPFRYEFLDQTYSRLYEMETRLNLIINVFTVLALIISCLGLFGLTSYTIEKRTKEIGIRKVLGASVTKMSTMLLKEFLKWVTLANLIAWPLAWLVMSDWLGNFVYHVSIHWQVFVLAGAAAIFLASLTVIFQSVRAAMRNPVEALRYE